MTGTQSSRPDSAIDAELARAIDIIRSGGVIGLPTETVYGLAADAASAAGVGAIYRIKGRPPGHPLIVHVAGREQAGYWSDQVAVDRRVQRLIDVFWPGPLTLIVRRASRAPAWACGGQSTIGLRAPAHPLAQRLLLQLHQAGVHGLAAPSANRFGRVSPSMAAHVRTDLGEAVPCVLDGGAADIGIESTIVDCSTDATRCLRPGRIRIRELEAVLGHSLDSVEGPVPQVSGSLASHYAPRTPLRLVTEQVWMQGDVSDLPAQRGDAPRGPIPIVCWSRPGVSPPGPALAQQVRILGQAAFPADPIEAEHALYAQLRALDDAGARAIWVVLPDHLAPDWNAFLDRLRRAATPAEGS